MPTTHKKTKYKIKKVKAFAVIVFNDFIGNFNSEDGFLGRAVFYGKDEAMRYLKWYLKQKEANLHDPKLVTIVISYKIKTK